MLITKLIDWTECHLLCRPDLSLAMMGDHRLAAATARLSPDDAHFAPLLHQYDRSNLSERIAILHREGNIAYNINFYRSASDGEITDAEERRLRQLLPVVNALIVARHKIVGADAFQLRPRREQVVSLKQGGTPLFRDLSGREAQLCDGLAVGLSLRGVALEMGVSENTAKTLRARAYRKLDIVSISQLFALLTRGGIAQTAPAADPNHRQKV